MVNYSIETVAVTGGKIDKDLFKEVIKLRNSTYEKPAELEPASAIKTRLTLKNQKQDPVTLEIRALLDENKKPVAFTILEKYLDDKGQVTSGCMTYANADPAFARNLENLKHLTDLHKATVAEGNKFPIIVECNPGDTTVLDRASDKSKHPLSLKNNQDPLIVEAVLKFGADPEQISPKLIEFLTKQAEGKRVTKKEVAEIVKSGANLLRDTEGNVVSAIVLAKYNAFNLQEEFDQKNPIDGGPGNLHIALVGFKGDKPNYLGAAVAYHDLNQSITIGNGGVTPNAATQILRQDPDYQKTIKQISSVQEIALKLGIASGPSPQKDLGHLLT